jgi:hypothetical protein
MTSNEAVEEFQNFTHSVAAARQLLHRAHANGSLIEGLVLYASLIDALLRILVAHATAEHHGSVKHFDPRFFRHDTTLWKNERQAYAAAAASGVLSDAERDELQALYGFRNVVIHRFIISGITYEEVGSRLDRYEVIANRLIARLEDIEQPAPALSDEETAVVRARIARKVGYSDPDDQRPE